MTDKEIFNHYKDMLDEMIDSTKFFPYWLQVLCPLDEDIHDICTNYNWHIHFGATRICFDDEQLDYIVKTDIDGYDMCERESNIYELAQEENLDKYLCEGRYIGTYFRHVKFYNAYEIERVLPNFYIWDEEQFESDLNESKKDLGDIQDITIRIPLYAYPRAIEHNYNLRSLGVDSSYEMIARKHHSPLKRRNLAVAVDFVYEYGEEEYVRLSNFFEENEVNDLHMGNFMDVNGRFCCTDYAGYFYSEEDSSFC